MSTTIPPAHTYTNGTVSLNPRLAVSPMQGILEASTNGTVIAESLASNLSELPIRPVFQRPPTCFGNSVVCTQATNQFNTSKGSNITVSFATGSFSELSYIVHDYPTKWDDYWNNRTYANPSASPTVAAATVRNLMLKAFGIDLNKLTLVDNITGPGWVEWSQQYRGLNIANSGVILFDFYPPTSQVIKLIVIENSGWHLIPSNFPLDTAASTALNSAQEYAESTLQMGLISYASISLQSIQDHIYYAATVSDQSKTYILFVNPITGEVGSPRS